MAGNIDKGRDFLHEYAIFMPRACDFSAIPKKISCSRNVAQE